MIKGLEQMNCEKLRNRAHLELRLRDVLLANCNYLKHRKKDTGAKLSISSQPCCNIAWDRSFTLGGSGWR